MRRHLSFAALAACLFICATTAFGAKPSHNYSKAEVDHLIDQLRSELLSKIPPKPAQQGAPPTAAPQGYSKAEVDDLLGKLRADIEQIAATKHDIAQATQPFVTTQQLDDTIDHAAKAAVLREQAKENKPPAVPAWISPSLAGAALFFSIAIPLRSRRNPVRHTTARADTVRKAAKERAREYINDWRAHAGDYTSAIALLRQGNQIAEPEALNQIAEIGTFFDRLAAEVSRGSTDASIIEDACLKGRAIKFRTALEPRLEPTIISNFAEWDDLRRLQ